MPKTVASTPAIRARNTTSIDDSACNLASIRLTAFLTEDRSFDHERFSAVVPIWTLVLEISVAAGQLPSAAIAANTWRLRNLGLGYTDLGAMLMRMGIPYDSEDAFGWASAVPRSIRRRLSHVGRNGTRARPLRIVRA